MEFNLADLWERVVDEIPDHEALVCGDRRLTYAEADARATRLAHHLADAGINAGDHVALYLYNGTEYLEGMLAAFKLRAVPININYRYVDDELAYLFENAHLVAVLTVLAVYGDSQTARPWWGDALLLAVVFSGLYAVARISQWGDERRKAPGRLMQPLGD